MLYVDPSAKRLPVLRKGCVRRKSEHGGAKKTSRSQFDGQNRSAGNTFVDVNKQFANN
jgi:hypothetical protein